MWIGFGMKPELTGQGLGAGFVQAGVDFAVRHYNYRGAAVMLFVAAFNRRAIRLYERLGFRETGRFTETIAGKPIEFIRMRKELRDEETRHD